MHNLNTMECTQISGGNQFTVLVMIVTGAMGAFTGCLIGAAVHGIGGGSAGDYLYSPQAYSATVIGGTIGAGVGFMGCL